MMERGLGIHVESRKRNGVVGGGFLSISYQLTFFPVPRMGEGGNIETYLNDQTLLQHPISTLLSLGNTILQ